MRPSPPALRLLLLAAAVVWVTAAACGGVEGHDDGGGLGGGGGATGGGSGGGGGGGATGGGSGGGSGGGGGGGATGGGSGGGGGGGATGGGSGGGGGGGATGGGTGGGGMGGGTATDGGADAGAPDAGAVVTCTALGLPGTCLDVSECYGTRVSTPGFCPGPTNIRCCTPRTAVACDWNAQPLPNVGLTEEAGDGGCPSGMLRVDTFCIDQFEASLQRLTGSDWSPYFPPTGIPVRARSLRGAVPQGYVTQTQAETACANAGKRLCTDTEWLRACRGPTSTIYPYGNTRQPGVCNDARGAHPAVELYGTSATWIYSHIDSPCLNQLDGGLDRTGANPGCVTAEGVFDMMGNLHEWTSDPAGTFRGGFYVDTVINGDGCLYLTTAHAVSHWDYSTGFRCCAD